MKYIFLVSFFFFHCFTDRLKLGQAYYNNNGDQYYFYNGDSCHIVSFEDDIWAKYYLHLDTLHVVSMFDSGRIEKVNYTFESGNVDSVKVKIFNNSRKTSILSWVDLMDSNYNVFLHENFSSASIKYVYPIMYMRLFAMNATSNTIKLNIQSGGTICVYFDYADYPNYPFNFHEVFLIVGNKLKSCSK